MTLSLLSVTVAEVEPLIAALAEADGQPPVNDQALVDARAGLRDSFCAEVGDEVVGVAVLGTTDAEFAILPAYRGRGYGRALWSAILDRRAVTSVWSHGDHPAAAHLAETTGFRRDRTLYRLAAPLPPAAALVDLGDRRIRTFDPAQDVEAWVALNARIFHDHPEQGALSAEDVRARLAEEWCTPENFLLLEDADGSLLGYNWLKVVPGDSDGEIYVLGVDPQAAGAGLGRALMNAAIARFHELGLTSTSLYVDDSNPGALALYRSLGYAEDTVDAQYHRVSTAVS